MAICNTKKNERENIRIIVIYLVGTIYIVTVSEDGGKITLALASNVMVIVMVIRTTIERDIFCNCPWKIIPAIMQNSNINSTTY